MKTETPNKSLKSEQREPTPPPSAAVGVENGHRSAPDTKSESIRGLSREEIADLEESFAVFDQAGEGTINASKLYRVMTSLIRDNPTEAEVQDLIVANDTDGK